MNTCGITISKKLYKIACSEWKSKWLAAKNIYRKYDRNFEIVESISFLLYATQSIHHTSTSFFFTLKFGVSHVLSE